MKKIYLLSLLVFINFLSFSQKSSMILELISDESFQDKIPGRISERYSTKELALGRLENKISKLRQKGYVEAAIDSVFYVSDTIFAHIHIGKKYKWGTIDYWENGGSVLADSYFGSLTKRNKSFASKDIDRFQESVLEVYGNSGFPFATCKLEKIRISDKLVSGTWRFDLNDFIVWDTIVAKGGLKIRKSFLHRFLGVKPQKAYRDNVLHSISEKINSLSFANEIKPAEIEFENGKAILYTYLEKEASNQFDGILGLQSNRNGKEKLELTGEVKLLLVNAFLAGEEIRFNWKKFDTESQNLSLGFVYPYLFSSGIGTDIGVNIRKQDSTYVSTKLNVGFRFLQSGSNYLKAFVRWHTSSLIATNHLRNLSVLPDYADVKSSLAGVGYRFENLDYAFNPKKGWRLDCNLSAGKRDIKKNSKLPENLYSNVKLSGTIIEAEWNVEYNQPISNFVSYRIHSKSGILDSPDLFGNDLTKLGGISTIRGFNEDTFRASAYSVLRNEIRFIPDKNSSYYFFWDGAYYKNEILDKQFDDFPWGIGLGLNFATKTGIFSLNYAIGKQKDQSLDVRNAKIHFGFVSRF